MAARFCGFPVEVKENVNEASLSVGTTNITDPLAVIMHIGTAAATFGRDVKRSSLLLQWMSFAVSELKPLQFAKYAVVTEARNFY